MIDLECPRCGRVGSVPNDKAHSRLVCRKCHTVFHMGPTGRPVLGEPPAPTAKKKGGRDQAQAGGHHPASAVAVKLPELGEMFSGLDVSRNQLLTALAVVAVLAVGAGYYYLAPVGNVVTVAQQVADALAADDLATIKRLSSSDSLDDVGRWYDSVHPKVEELRKLSSGQKLLVTVLVVEENAARKSGQVEAFFAGGKGPERAETIVAEAGTTPARSTIDVPLYWTYGRGGWRLDGRRTLSFANAPQR